MGRRITACQLARAVWPQAQNLGHGFRWKNRPEKCGRGRNDTARLRNMAVGRKMQPWGREGGKPVVEMYLQSTKWA